MATQSITASPNWTSLEGRVLDGGYELEESFAAGSVSASFHVRVLGDRFAKVIAEVFAASAVSPEQFALWNDAHEFRSPALTTPIAVNRLDWDGTLCPYILARKPDEDLAGVLKDRSLTAAETRELLSSMTAALEHLHTRGFVHGNVSPEQTLAFGNAIQLTTTSVRRINTPLAATLSSIRYVAPESERENLTPAADIWSLGATIYEVLTAKEFSPASRDEADALAVPFNSIVRRSTDPDPQTRCTLSDVEAMLRGEQLEPAAASVPAPSPEAPTVIAAAAGASGSTASSTATPSPSGPPTAHANGTSAGTLPPPVFLVRPNRAPQAVAAPPPKPKLAPPAKPVYRGDQPRGRAQSAHPEQESPRLKFWSYAALGLVLVACLLWITRPRNTKPTPTAGPRITSSGAQTPTPNAGNSPLPGSQSRIVEPAPPGTASVQPAHSGSAASAADAWRVVVYTFAKQDDAQKRVDAINHDHPGFSPQVYSTDAKGPYLVVLGSDLTREEANRLRQKARSSGLPRDAYVQNFKR